MALVFDSLDDPKVVQMLLDGATGILPTDTVYGLVCRAADKEAVNKLFQIKPRELKPGTLIAASVEQIVELGIPRRYLTAVEQYWPGAISIVIPADNKLEYLHLGKGSFPVRVPAGKQLNAFLEKTGPLLTTSANWPDDPTVTNIKDAQSVFADKVDFYVDGGDMSSHKPSTIIRIIDDEIEVIRDGAVKIV